MMYCVTFCVMLLVMPVMITQIYLNGKSLLVALSLYGFIHPLQKLSPTFIFIYEMDLFHWQLDESINYVNASFIADIDIVEVVEPDCRS